MGMSHLSDLPKGKEQDVVKGHYECLLLPPLFFNDGITPENSENGLIRNWLCVLFCPSGVLHFYESTTVLVLSGAFSSHQS